MIRMAILLTAVLSLAFAPVPFRKPDSTKGDLKKLQGTWVRVHYVLNGKPTAPALPMAIVIAGERLQYVQSGSSSSSDWKLILDASKKPKVFDIKGISPGMQQFTFLGVYRLEGDTLTVHSCRTSIEKLRPTNFDGKQADLYIEIFKRDKR